MSRRTRKNSKPVYSKSSRKTGSSKEDGGIMIMGIIPFRFFRISMEKSCLIYSAVLECTTVECCHKESIASRGKIGTQPPNSTLPQFNPQNANNGYLPYVLHGGIYLRSRPPKKTSSFCLNKEVV